MVHAHVKVNPLTPKRDQDRMSPYKIVYVINKQTCDANKEKGRKQGEIWIGFWKWKG